MANIAIQLSSYNSSNLQDNRVLFSKSYVHDSYKPNSPISVDQSIYMSGPTISQLITKLVALNLVPNEKKTLTVNEILNSVQSKISISQDIVGDYVSWSRMLPIIPANAFVTFQNLLIGNSGFDFRNDLDLYLSNNPQSSSSVSLMQVFEQNIQSHLAPRIRQVNQLKNRIDVDGMALMGYIIHKLSENQSLDYIYSNQFKTVFNLQSSYPLFNSDVRDSSNFVKATKENDILSEDSNFKYYSIYPVTTNLFSTCADLNKIGVYVMSKYSEKEIQDMNLLSYATHNNQVYYYQFSKVGNYLTAIITFPKENLVLSISGLGGSYEVADDMIQQFSYNILPNTKCSDYDNLVLVSNGTCQLTSSLTSIVPLYKKEYFDSFKKNYAGCYVNSEFSHSTFRKYFTMKEMICIDAPISSSNYLTAKLYNFDPNQPSATGTIPIGSDEFIFVQEFGFDSFRMGHLSNGMVTFDNYVSNHSWTFSVKSGENVVYLTGPYDTQRYERFDDRLSTFIIYLVFGAPFVFGFVAPFIHLFFLVFEVRDRAKNGFNNLANADLSHIMLSGNNYQSSDEDSDEELDENIESSLKRYSSRVQLERKNSIKKKKKKKSDMGVKKSAAKKWSIILSIFIFHIFALFLFTALKAINILTIFGIWQQWTAMLYLPLVSIILTFLCAILIPIIMCIRVKFRTISGWVFTLVYLFFLLLDIGFIVILMKINWFGFWNQM
ncbi:predicted protein [Naegleria gruberi]|uniref:Predicted protein n=1 Tax=Naegleria gruberi TaxID=5762 RepID=D2VBZ3_NAEGR|nr:uncharacterized protein NAEGRDRAFT_66389 [Naegleria gruberi]EFC45659.1 predicted protein [Naegleria gruberi]|eukprot:XP_002678403.1 predicted protein [Naegleria gruberi strain NEG-M]